MAKVIDRFGDKGAGDRSLMPGWPAHTAVPRANHSLDLNQFQHRDQLPHLAGQRTQLLLQSREQNALHDALELIQEAGNSKLNKAGFLYIRFGRITQF